jgi:hypothetical protein
MNNKTLEELPKTVLKLGALGLAAVIFFNTFVSGACVSTVNAISGGVTNGVSNLLAA